MEVKAVRRMRAISFFKEASEVKKGNVRRYKDKNCASENKIYRMIVATRYLPCNRGQLMITERKKRGSRSCRAI
jgi:hypothetical protein